MARKKGRNFRRSRGIEIPLTIVAGFMPGLLAAWQERPGGGAYGASWAKVGQTLSRAYFGYNPYPLGYYGIQQTQGFHFEDLRYGALPLVAGVLAHKVANRLGVNRMLRRAGIPVVRV